ncbi:hypothetical protein Tco_0013125 [Tanacetum coccineum]
MAETMEQYMSKTRTDYGSGVAKPKIKEKDSFELKGQFLKEFRENTFSGSDNKDANEHIEKVLEIVNLFHVPNITVDQLMLRVFPISLTGAQESDKTLYQAWERFKELLMKCPQHYLTEMQEKWHNRISRSRSTETSDGLATIQAQLNNLGREIKKLNEKVYAAQVGYEQCKGPHYTKDCPLKEKGKTLEEAYYMKFGGPFQGRGYRAATSGFYQRNNANPLYQERRQSMEDTLSKFMSELAKRHKNSNLIKEIRALTDAVIHNQGASIKTLEIQIMQMSKNRTLMYETRQTTILFPSRLNGYYYEEKKGSYGPQLSEAYFEASQSILQMEKDPGSSLYLALLIISLDPFLEDYIELNDINEPFELKRNQRDDMIPTIKKDEVIEEYRTRDDELNVGIDDYPSYCEYDKKIHIYCAYNLKFSCKIGFEFTHANFFPLLYVNVMSKKFHNSIIKDKMVYKGNNVIGALMNVSIFVGTFSVMTNFIVLENVDDYRDEGMDDVIVGESFLREVEIKARWFDGMITIYNGNDEVSKKDEKNGISHAYQKLKGFYKGVLNLGPDYIRNAKTREWLICGTLEAKKYRQILVENLQIALYKVEDIATYLVEFVKFWDDWEVDRYGNTNLVIMEYLVNISKRRPFWSLNEDIMKITILKTNTPYPSRKIQRIRARIHQRSQRNKAQYAISRRPIRRRFIGPPSPDYIPDPEEPQSPPLPDFVPDPVYPEFMPLEDEILPAEEQPLPTIDSPTADSPGYILESDPEEDPKEDDDEDPEEDPADYPADGGDDGDDEDEPSDDDKDEEVDIEADDDEEEEHPAPLDSTAVALPAIDQAPSVEETELVETDESAATPPPHPLYRVTARISIPDLVPTPVWSDAEVARLLAISTPPSSLLSPWSSPPPQIPSPPLPLILSPLPVSPPLPQIPSPPLPVSSPVPVLFPPPPTSPIRPLGYRAVMIRLRAEAASTSHSLPLPPPIILSYTRPDAPSSRIPPLHLLSTDRRADRHEVTLPPRKRELPAKVNKARDLRVLHLGPGYEVEESSSAAAAARPAGGLRADYGCVATMDKEIRRDLERDVGYRITNSWDEIVEAMHGTPVVTDVAEFSQRMTEFESRVRQDTYEIYTRLDDEQSERQLMAGRLNMLYRDRRTHARTARLMKTEARMSREAWGRSMDSADRRRQTVITEMLAANHKRQVQLIKALKLVKRLQTQMAELLRQQGPAKGPTQPELPEEASSSS